MKRTRNSEVLRDFTEYCEKYPDLRFWQALRSWSGYPFILVSNIPPDVPRGTTTKPPKQADTFYWEGRKE